MRKFEVPERSCGAALRTIVWVSEKSDCVLNKGQQIFQVPQNHFTMMSYMSYISRQRA